MDEQQLREVYQMVDNIPFSKPKRNIARDFADGVMMAQLIYYYQPKLVSLHNYPSANSSSKKIANWTTLNNKVLKKLGIPIGKGHIEDIVNAVPQAVQSYLYTVLMKLEKPEEEIKITAQVSRQPETPKNSFSQINQQQTHQVHKPRQREREIQQKTEETFNRGNQETEEILELVEQIESAYAHLSKLQEMSKLKDEVIKNLEKKVDKIIFS